MKMIQITPAILTNDINKFNEYLNKFLKVGDIDIDIIEKDFVDNETVEIESIINNDTLLDYQNIGWHLMVNDPENKAKMLLNSHFKDKECRIYAQQEVALKSYLELKLPNNWSKCICLQIETKLESIEFYNNFDEVQFMSVKIGNQGNKFNSEALSKVDTLRQMGYNGNVSLDGGINLETAQYIAEHDIDRVSVGSFFSKALDKEEAYRQLNEILN